MSTTTTTPKGTKLPLMNLKGKPYLQVAHRLIWFREEEPQAGIETQPLAMTEEYAVFQAKILRQGMVVATATKRESKKDFPDFIEKAETGAIGRALALLGYGTQFATADLDEGSRLADSPAMPGVKASSSKTEELYSVTAADVAASVTSKVFSEAPKKKPAFIKPSAKVEALVSAQPASNGNAAKAAASSEGWD